MIFQSLRQEQGGASFIPTPVSTTTLDPCIKAIMGYYYTAEPETAVPGNSSATPKTHTPASPVKERGHRYYQPETGRWAGRDPLGEWNVLSRILKRIPQKEYQLFYIRLSRLPSYYFAENSPICNGDILGLFGEGMPNNREEWEHNPNAKPGDYRPLGHGDFPGGDEFDYNKQDKDWRTSPNPFWGEPASHFQDLPESEKEVKEARDNCDQEKFQRAMHKGQDFYSHYDKGYRWDPWNTSDKDFGLGHGPDSVFGETPDGDEDAWGRAAEWTSKQLDDWNAHCEKCGDKWQKK